MYNFLIIGHGHLPQGLCSAFEMLTGIKNIFQVKELTDDTDFTIFEQELTAIFETKQNWIVFADLVGGSPMQTILKIGLLQNKDFIVVAGINLVLIIDIYFKLSNQNIAINEAKKLINASILEAKDLIQLIDSNSLKEVKNEKNT